MAIHGQIFIWVLQPPVDNYTPVKKSIQAPIETLVQLTLDFWYFVSEWALIIIITTYSFPNLLAIEVVPIVWMLWTECYWTAICYLEAPAWKRRYTLEIQLYLMYASVGKKKQDRRAIISRNR